METAYQGSMGPGWESASINYCWVSVAACLCRNIDRQFSLNGCNYWFAFVAECLDCVFSRAFEKVQRRFVFFVSLHGRASAKSYEKA